MPIPQDGADEWISRHFADDPAAAVEIEFVIPERPNASAYRRLLEILFAPRPEGDGF